MSIKPNYINFYINESEQKAYDKNIKILKADYETLINILLTNEHIVNEILKDINLAPLIQKGSSVAVSYFQETIYIKKDFFRNISEKESQKNMFVVKSTAYANKKYKTDYKNAKPHQKKYAPNITSYFDFIPSDTNYNVYENRPEDVLALLVFSVFFSLKFEDLLKTTNKYDEIHKLRKRYYFTLKNTKALPQIGQNNIKDVKQILDTQKAYKEIFTRSDKLLSEYELLEHNKKLNSFNFSNKTIKFDSLYCDKGLKYYKVEGVQSPSLIIKKIALKLKDKNLEDILNIYKNLEVESKQDYVLSAMNIIYLLHAPRTNLDEETNLTSPFNTEFKKLLEFISDLSFKRKALDEDTKEFIEENYLIHDIYNKMQFDLIAHAYLAQEQKRKQNVENFLLQFPVKKLKYELVLPDLLDNNIDEEFRAKAKIEKLYEYLKALDGSSSKIGDAFDEMGKGNFDDDGDKKNITSKLNTPIKAISFLLAGTNIIKLISGKEKLSIPSVIGLINDISLLANMSAKTAYDYMRTTAIKNPKSFMQKLFTKENAKFISTTSSKVIAFLGIPMIIVSSIFDTKSLLKNEDYDATFFLNVKNMIVISLLLTTSIVGFLSLAILEIAWYLLSHLVIDSSLQRYIQRSLFFQYKPYIEVSYKNKSIWGNSFNPHILLNTTSYNKELKDISKDGFNSVKNIKKFIGENYNKNKSVFETSLKSELNQIKLSLLGYKISLLDKDVKKTISTLSNGRDVKSTFNTIVKISKELISNSLILVSSNGIYKQVKASPYEEHVIYDFTKPAYHDYNLESKGSSEVELLSSANTYIILANENVELKYKVIFKTQYSSVGFAPIINVRIQELKEELLNDIDYETIEDIKEEKIRRIKQKIEDEKRQKEEEEKNAWKKKWADYDDEDDDEYE